jgi:hypothetical protein
LSAPATGHLTLMFFVIDVVARWFARWDDGIEADRDPLASPDHAGPRGHGGRADTPWRRAV